MRISMHWLGSGGMKGTTLQDAFPSKPRSPVAWADETLRGPGEVNLLATAPLYTK